MAQADPPTAEEPSESGTAPSESSSAGVEEIVVRGGTSELLEDFQKADSVAAFSAADLVALGAASIADLATFTPNLEIVTSGSTTPTFFIRGVGLNDFGANATSAVAIYQDDVPFNAQALQLPNLYDVETVNILRGPQGSGLARNSSAGAIKQYGRKPTGQFNGYLRGQWGNFDAQEYEGAVEAPIFQDLLSARLAFFSTQRDGTMRNRCGSAPAIGQRVIQPGFFEMSAQRKIATSDPWSICGEVVEDSSVSDIPEGLPDWMNDRNNWAARGTLLFEPTLDTSFLLNAHGARRNELSRVGQSYGTTGSLWCLNNNFADCRTAYPAGSLITSALGGTQFLAGYQAPEVKQRLTDLAPCYQLGFGFNRGLGEGGCTGNPNNAVFQQYSRAVQKVARELSRDLDDEPWEGDFNHAGKTTNDTVGSYLRGEILLPYELKLTSTSAWDRYYRQIDVDLDFSPTTLFHIETHDDGWQFYQDLKLEGETEVLPDSPVSWDIGGWVLNEKLDVKVHNTLQTAVQFAGIGDRFYEQRMLSMGGYGNFAFDFWDNFTLDGGARWNWERKDIDYFLLEGIAQLRTNLNEHDVWVAPTGTLKLTYHFDENTEVYWKYNRGWKPGHYNATGSSFTGITVADPETIDAFETGLHAEWFGGFIGTEAALFYYRYENYQIFTTQQLADATPEFVVINANNAEVYGIDGNVRVNPWPGGYVNVNIGWLETQFLDFVTTLQVRERPANRFPFIAGREIQNSGNPVLNSPRFKVAITAEQAIPLGKYGFLIPRYDGAWSDITYYDPTKGKGVPNVDNDFQYLPRYTIAQRAYWIHNARIGYRTPDGRIEIAGWVRNIENKAYKNYAFDASTFFQTTIHFVGDPRTYGGTVTVTF